MIHAVNARFSGSPPDAGRFLFTPGPCTTFFAEPLSVIVRHPRVTRSLDVRASKIAAHFDAAFHAMLRCRVGRGGRRMASELPLSPVLSQQMNPPGNHVLKRAR